MKKPELLIPAGSLEVLKTAVRYGADAVYIGGEVFSLRAKAHNFSLEEMEEGISYAHAHGVKVHVTANILAHNYDLEEAERYFAMLRDMANPPDALIISDPGMFTLAKQVWPEVEIHISTQANNTNYQTFLFWYRQGAKRVVTARELSLREIKEIREHIPEDMEIESFIHGAMCISYSGRCLLSNYFTGRDANRGACTHPCRWKYALMEEQRPGEYLPVFENERGTYIFNSKDLCMITHIPDMMDAGIDSYKIEGRMKTALYVATVARTYRRAIDNLLESREKYEADMAWYEKQIAQCTYRKFSTGFYYGKPDENSQIYDNNTYISEAVYFGRVDGVCLVDEQGRIRDAAGTNVGSLAQNHGNLGKDAQTNAICNLPDNGNNKNLVPGHYISFIQKNKFSVGDTIEIMKPDGNDIKARVLALYHVCDDREKRRPEDFICSLGCLRRADACPHAREQMWAVLEHPAEIGDLLRG
ncbi:MAG: U32 family peptidase [Lachnospiraceae bacterium]